MSDEDEEQNEGQGDSSAEDVEESETEEERDARLDHGEKRSAVVRTQAGYAFVNGRIKRTDEVTRDDDKRTRIVEEVLDVSISASHQEKRTIRIAVAFSKQPAKADPVENMAPKTPQTPEVPRMKAPAPDTGNYEVRGSSQLDYTVLACQERETGKLTFRLLPKGKTVSVPKDKEVTATTPSAPKTIRIAHVSAFSGLKDHARYTQFRYARASPTGFGKIHGQEHQQPLKFPSETPGCSGGL